ncbi:MAG: hypothetical protein SF097_09885 [Acidobacteriota bacterium]|nr:hypothetical protein [Acidobacteriota bacterium]
MYAIEFQTKISNGSIELPQEFVGKLVGEVRVIVLKQEQSAGAENLPESLIDRLMNAPISLDAFKPMSREDIYEQA